MNSETKQIQEAADKGDAEAQHRLAECYASGVGAALDISQAAAWYAKAAAQGHVQAQCDLGVCYAEGRGVEQDYGLAIKWFAKAARRGHSEAQTHLGNRYANGEGVPQDLEMAVKWYRTAAFKGFPEAQHRLALCLLDGQGIEPDETEAIKLLKLAVDQGHPGALTTLGGLYADGRGLDRDIDKAFELYREAADRGFPEAQYRLGQCYADGQGVEADKLMAKAWYSKAAGQGHEWAQCKLGLARPVRSRRSVPVKGVSGGAGPADGTTKEDLNMSKAITPQNLSVETLFDLFTTAYFEAHIDKDGTLVVHDDYRVIVEPTKRKETLRFVVLFGVREGVKEEDMYALCNRINDNLLVVRASFHEPSSLVIDWDIPVKGGIAPQTLVHAFRKFNRVVGDIGEHDTQDLLT